MIIDCNIILENHKSKELTGVEELILVPALIDLTDVVHFRQSTTDHGDLEDYTIIYTETTGSLCIDIPFLELRDLFLKFKNYDSKTF
jgi:hypothetical protein